MMVVMTMVIIGEEKSKEFYSGEILSNEKKIRATVKVGITSKLKKTINIS